MIASPVQVKLMPENSPMFNKGCIIALCSIVLIPIGIATIGAAGDWFLRIKNPTQRYQDKPAMKGLEMAIKGHLAEYTGEHLLSELWTSEGIPIRSEGELLKALMAEDHRRNPRNIPFYEPPPERPKGSMRGGAVKREDGSLQLVDRHGNPFWLLLDISEDGKVPNPDPDEEDKEIVGTILIYSSGEDGNPATWRDNLKSWE
jgi:hypothetical protein